MRSRLVFSGAFFLSGAAGLLFETLWFRLAGLAFGNTAWAAAIVLSSFMAGIAIGNLAAARARPDVDPRLLYVMLEIGIMISGVSLVLLLPRFPQAFAPLMRGALDHPLALNSLRLALAFALLAIPAMLMGATLPTGIRALQPSTDDYAGSLGVLYGCNTLGAMAGALAGELLLIRRLGIFGTSSVAAAFDLLAAALVLMLPAEKRREETFPSTAWSSRLVRGLIAAALCGFALLALEVLWFRFLILFLLANAVAFAVMLAVVLGGIGLGAIAASMVDARSPIDRFAAVAAALGGIALIVAYRTFDPIAPAGRDYWLRRENVAAIVDSVRLMLPVCIASGFLFAAIGRSIARDVHEARRATSLLTFANTAGAAVGAVAAGFFMIPSFGVERSLLCIAAVYGVAGLLTIRNLSAAALAGPVALVATLFFFPRGLMREKFIPLATHAFRNDTTTIQTIREGSVETSVYLQTDFARRPYVYRLFTDGFSMSATTFLSRRYMTLFATLPLAFRPSARSALLISYGVGVTAKALTDSQRLTSIDVVDVSRDILDSSEIVWVGAGNPLRDPRVRVHVEDGRFFLLTTPKRFDVVTAEPPPPKNAGVVSLYTLEYFRLLRDRLTAGGIATYWLPVDQLTVSDSRSLVAAFCGAFDDCSLWNGSGPNWILMGSRGGIRMPAADEFTAQWRDPSTRSSLMAIGVENPAQLLATFLADADMLRAFVGDHRPVTDDRPSRLSSEQPRAETADVPQWRRDAERNFLVSRFVAHSVPAGLRSQTHDAFGVQRAIDQILLGGQQARSMDSVREALKDTSLTTFPRLLLGTDPWLENAAREAAARGDRSAEVLHVLAVGALSDRQYASAQRLFDEAAQKGYRDTPH